MEDAIEINPVFFELHNIKIDGFQLPEISFEKNMDLVQPAQVISWIFFRKVKLRSYYF